MSLKKFNPLLDLCDRWQGGYISVATNVRDSDETRDEASSTLFQPMCPSILFLTRGAEDQMYLTIFYEMSQGTMS
jgi:hypothetical protein